MERLFIHLVREEWALFLNGQRVSSGNGLRSLPAAGAPSRRLIVFVPGEDVLLTHVKVPAKQRRQLHKVLPYLVEEQLAEDVSQVHVVADVAAQEDVLPVAVVRRSTLEVWLAALADAGIAPHILLPETLALSYQQHQWTLMADDRRFYLRNGVCAGMTAEHAMLSGFIDLLLADSSSNVRVMDCYLAEGGDVLMPWLTQLAERFPRLTIRNIRSPGSIFETMCIACAQMEEPTLHLLPRKNQPKSSRRSAYGLVYKLGWIAGVWFVAQVMLDVGAALYFEHAAASAQEEARNFYQTIYIGEPTVSDPARQMKKRLSMAQGTSEGGDFLTLLGKVGAVWEEGGPYPIMKHIAYAEDTHTLTLKLEAATLDMVNALVRRLSDARLKAEVISVVGEEDKIKAQVTIQGDGL